MPVQSVKINKNLFKLVSIKDLTGGRSSRISMRELDSASTYIGHLLGESVADIKNILTNADSSKIQVYVVPTNEELLIARYAVSLINR